MAGQALENGRAHGARVEASCRLMPDLNSLIASVLWLLIALPQVALADVEGYPDFEHWAERKPLTAAQVSDLEVGRTKYALKALADLESRNDKSRRFNVLPRAAIAAFDLERYDDARRYAEEALTAAVDHAGHWNYGNAIHDAHMTLGLLALRDGDDARALEELRLAGETPGSPQLGSFGPSMQLAKAMLARGHTNAVLAYFTQCRRFWHMGKTWLDVWEAKVREGRSPNFMLHAYR